MARHAGASLCRTLRCDSNARRYAPPMPRAPERIRRLLGGHTVNAGFALSLAILAGIAAFSYASIRGFNERAKWVEPTREILLATEKALSDLKDVETSLPGHIISGQDSFLDVYRDALAGIPGRLERLTRLTADNPRLVTRYDGRAWAEAAVNEGATFNFSLPGKD